MAWAEMSSDDEDFVVPTIAGVGGGFAAKKDWEDEDAEVLAEAAAPAPAPVPAHLKPKALAKKRREEAAARRKAEAEEAAKRRAELAPLEDAAAERARQRKLVEDADHALTADLFADEKVDSISAPVMSLVLDDADDFTKFGQATARRLNAAENPLLTLQFFSALITNTEESLTPNDIQKVVKELNQLRNKKIKAESQAKKKKGKKKPKAKMQSDNDWMDVQAGAYEEGGDVGYQDEYDFF